jgi:hypothetical protein
LFIELKKIFQFFFPPSRHHIVSFYFISMVIQSLAWHETQQNSQLNSIKKCEGVEMKIN